MTSAKLSMLALAGLTLLSLTGCAQFSGTKEYVYVTDAIPQSLLADCPGYSGPLDRNRDLAEAYRAERQGRMTCNADKQSLREWEAKRQGKVK